MNEVILNYRKLRFYIKKSNIPFNIKQLGLKYYNNGKIEITFQDMPIGRWWEILDECLIWDRCKEGFDYWYEQHLKLVYFAMLVSNEDLMPYFVNKISRLLCRTLTDKESNIKFNFIINCEKNKIINKEIISKWKTVIKENEKVYF